MWRAFFFSTGLFVTLVGASFLLVDKMTLNVKADAPKGKGFRGMFTGVSPDKKMIVDPPDWAAFSLMSVGTVNLLYTFALPKKQH